MGKKKAMSREDLPQQDGVGVGVGVGGSGGKSTKKKKKKKNLVIDDDEYSIGSELPEAESSLVKEDDSSESMFSGKTKKPKGSSIVAAATPTPVDDAKTEIVSDATEGSSTTNEPSKKKKKKKKQSEKTKDDDDGGKEVGESSSIPIPEEGGGKEEEGGVVESAAARKKRKKKEKEKEKKAAAANSEEKLKREGEVMKTKKLPKHVREKQEALARRQEEEERRRKEDEERSRKEEEERVRLVELERLAEARRVSKKAKEKEKRLLKKVRDEEVSREIARKKLGVVSLVKAENGVSNKLPSYTTKKAKSQINGSKVRTLDETTEEKVDAVETTKIVACTMEEEEEEEGDDDWDAKSWDDDTDLRLSVNGSFDEEDDTESESESIANSSAGPSLGVKPDAVVAAKKAMSEPNKGESEQLRSPICCIMGHVDTGKTKLLDYIRGTNVQEGEAGGITQQIGATYFPAVNLRERTKELKADATVNVPGLLVIDTPGHESFTNLRSRGSGLCDIAILVVDIMHGLEPQTVESLNLLRMRNTEFIVALNKVDRLYGWKKCRNAPIVKALKQQSRDVQNKFNMRLNQIITEFKEQGLNTQLYYKNKEMGETFSIVPTSAISGEGIPDLLLLLVQWTQKTMTKKLTFSNKVQCTVLEVKVVEGHGTTIDVVLVNGLLREGDQIVVCGMQGPIVTNIRALLTPHPMKELRIKGTYLHHKEIKAAQGIKISAQGLENAVAGTGLYVVSPDDNLERIIDLAKEDMDSVMSKIDKSGEGVYVQASTLGSLEALLEFLKSPAVNIPVNAVSIGPVHKKDVMKAGVMIEKKKEYATILAFDVKITPEAREYADEVGVRIFTADIIYHLFDQFKAYIDEIKQEKKKEVADEAVFPCVLKIIPSFVFNKKDPIVLGVDVLEGSVKVGTPICIPSQDFIDIGRIASIENNRKPVDIAKKGQKVAIKIVGTNPEEQQKMVGRHFDIEDELVSHVSRNSIDTIKANYMDDMTKEDWKLLYKLKKLFRIQ